jgi:polar amino acid transport system substrate-binding protein
VRAVGNRLNLEFQLTPLPWQRCLASVANGQQDGAVAASYLPERAEFAVYPTLISGRADASRRLNMDRYVLYRHIGRPLFWDGKALQGPHNKTVIAMPLGYSVKKRLRNLGVELDESDKDSYQILRKLALGSADGAALLAYEGSATLRIHPDLAPSVTQMPIDLEDKPYYLIFGKGFSATHQILAEQVWAMIAEVRTSSAFVQQCVAKGVKP